MPGAGSAAAVGKTHAESETQTQTHAETSHAAATRICGECTACCTVLGVVELNKPAYTTCRHDCGRCAIYESRPKTCRIWSCGWLLSHIEGDERRRPDRLGLLFNREALDGKPITVVYEVWPDAATHSNNAFLLRKMSQQMPIVLRAYQTRKCTVITPDRQKQQYILRLIESDWYPKEEAARSPLGYFSSDSLDR
jgi:hypothetical protein